DRKSTRLNSSHVSSSYAVFCSKKKTHGPDGPRADAGLAAAFEPRCQPRREPAGGEHAGGTREGLGVLRAIRLRAGATRPAGGGMCAFLFTVTATTQLYTLSLHDALPI